MKRLGNTESSCSRNWFRCTLSHKALLVANDYWNLWLNCRLLGADGGFSIQRDPTHFNPWYRQWKKAYVLIAISVLPLGYNFRERLLTLAIETTMLLFSPSGPIFAKFSWLVDVVVDITVNDQSNTSFWSSKGRCQLAMTIVFLVLVHVYRRTQAAASGAAERANVGLCRAFLLWIKFIYLFKHQRQRAEATYMPVKSIQ